MSHAHTFLGPSLVLGSWKSSTFCPSANTMVAFDVEREDRTATLDVSAVALNLGEHHRLVIKLFYSRGEVVLLES